MNPAPFSALVAALMLAVAAPNAFAGSMPSSADKSTLVSNLGGTVPARPDSAVQSSGEWPSWNGTGALPKFRATEPEGMGPAISVPPPHDGSILGVDRRVRVKSTADYPARATTFIVFTQGDFRLSCTGWFVGKDTVATAGHCLNSGPQWGNLWSTKVTIYPGRNGSSSPYGSCGAKRLWTVKGWTENGDERYDYGAIKLDCTIGAATGWYGFFWQAKSLKGYISTTQGYPNDKARGTQWLSRNCADSSTFLPCRIAVTRRRQLFYDNDTMGGQSGSPVYVKRSGACRPCVMAIHGYALHGVYPHNTYNHGARITQSVYNFLRRVANM